MSSSSAVWDEDLQRRLKKEQDRATKLLAGRVLERVIRNRVGEVLLEFKDGSRLFVNEQDGNLDLTVTGNFDSTE